MPVWLSIVLRSPTSYEKMQSQLNTSAPGNYKKKKSKIKFSLQLNAMDLQEDAGR